MAVIRDEANYQELETLADKLKDTPLVMFGEIHQTHFGLRKHLLNQVRASKQGRVCMLYELNRNLSVTQHLKAFSQPGFEINKKYLNQLHQISKVSGWKEFAVDVESSPEDFSSEEVNRRDRAMAQHIDHLLKTECDSAVMFVGKAHVTNEDNKRMNLNQQLKKIEVKTQVVNLQVSNDFAMTKAWGADAVDLQSWSGVCQKSQKLPSLKRPMIFLNKNLPAKTRMYPRAQSDQSTWDSFDFTILAPDYELLNTQETS